MRKSDTVKRVNLGISGVALAIAAAGCASNDTAAVGDTAEANTVELVHCYGVNVCGGHNDCKSEAHACAGQGSCQGTGFVGMPEKACKDIGGELRDSARYQVNSVDLVHCHGVNVCAGHNDCSTAANACAGQGSCQGTGFVTTTAKSCKDIGGKVEA